MLQQDQVVPFTAGIIVTLLFLKYGDDVPILEQIAQPVRTWVNA
jgi:hypothetical protein